MASEQVSITAEITLWPSETCLISELAAMLTTLSPSELRDCQLVLPTKRLVPWLLALMARSRPAFVPPRCFTLDDFIRNHSDSLAIGTAQPALSDLAQELLLAALLKDSSYRHLLPGHEHEVKQFLAELVDWNLDLDKIIDLSQEVKQSAFLSDGGIDTLGERFTELHDLAQRYYQAASDLLGGVPSELHLARQSQALAEHWRESATPWRQLYIVGLTSAQGMHAPLLETLAGRSDVRFWLSEPPPLSGTHNPLTMLLGMLTPNGAQANQAPVICHRTSSRTQPPTTLQVVRAPSLLSEVNHALHLAEKAVAEGLAPSAIALLVTNDAAYGKPVRALLADSPLTPNLAIGTPLAQTELGTWLTAFFEILSGEPSSARLLAFLVHPLTLSWWESQADYTTITTGSTESGKSEAPATPLALRLTKEICSWEEVVALPQLATALSPELQPFGAALLERLGPLVPKQGAPTLSLATWADSFAWNLRAFLAQTESTLNTGERDRGLTASALAGIEDFLSQLSSTAAALPGRFSQREFITLVRERLLGLDVRSVGDPLRGLQVLSVAEARYVPFDLGIVLGCSEGDFPRALPRDHLVDHYLKTRIGLPSWHLLEAIEDTTFHLLRARLPGMVLLYPESRGGETAVRSRFIETALALGEAREVAAESEISRLTHMSWGPGSNGDATADPELNARLTRRSGPRGVFASDVAEQLLAMQSATSLEYLLACPYRFLLQRLKVTRADLPEDKDSRQQGDWLHAILEAFFTGCIDKEQVLPPFSTASLGFDARSEVMARLTTLTERLMPAATQESPLALHLQRHAWPAFSDHVLKLHRQAARAGWREQQLRHPDGRPVQIELGGRLIQLNGLIDSVDSWDDWYLITDYKRFGSPDKQMIKRGHAPQLLLYALAMRQMQPELDINRAVVGYWSILAGEWREGLAGESAVSSARAAGVFGGRDQDGLEASIDNLKALWQQRHDEILSEGMFRPDAKRCGYCEYSGVCRRDDPALALHRDLTESLDGLGALDFGGSGGSGAAPHLSDEV